MAKKSERKKLTGTEKRELRYTFRMMRKANKERMKNVLHKNVEDCRALGNGLYVIDLEPDEVTGDVQTLMFHNGGRFAKEK